MGEWNPAERVRVNAGARLNLTNEARDAGSANVQDTAAEHARTDVRPSGSVGIMWTPWQQGANRVALFADYRSTFKPAAFDFGIGAADAGAEHLLKPETSQNYEVGLKSRAWSGRMSMEVSGFVMNFANLVIPQAVNGLPALANAGTERFKGVETALAWYLPGHVTARATWSLHDARFRDYVTEFDGVPTQLAGKRIEMSARELASAGLLYSPLHGVFAGMEWDYVGSRYLDKRNRSLTGGYSTLGGGIGYRAGRYEARLDGSNLASQRPPISESELGDAQYYRLPARRVDGTFSVRF
jgi:iron complex outermembrane receptor protein